MNLPKLTQEPIIHVDATPDDDYPLRILKAYRENCNVRWSDTPDGGDSSKWLFKQMNKDCEKRAEILDRAIVILKEGEMPNDEYNIECEDCGWSGDTSNLVALTDDLNDKDFSHCPDCGSKDIVDID